MPRSPAHELTGTKMAGYIGMTNVELKAIKTTIIRGMQDASLEPRDWMHLFGRVLDMVEEAQAQNQRALELVQDHGEIGPFYDPVREMELLAQRVRELWGEVQDAD